MFCLKGIDCLIAELKQTYTSKDRLKEAKDFMSKGNYKEALEEVNLGIEKEVEGNYQNEKIASLLYLAKDTMERIILAQKYYSAQRFIDAKEEYEKVMEKMELLGVNSFSGLVEEIERASIMAEAETKYLMMTKDDKALKIANKVKDNESRDFMGKIRKINTLNPGDEKCKKDIDVLRVRYPEDRRILHLEEEFIRIQEKNKEIKIQGKSLLKDTSVLIKRLNGNNVDELVDLIGSVIDLVGITKEVRTLIGIAVDQYAKSKNNFEAFKLLEEIKEMASNGEYVYGDKLEALRIKFEEAVKKERLEAKKLWAEKIFTKADKWIIKADEVKKLKKIFKDIARIVHSGVLQGKARQYYMKMLLCAYDHGYYEDVLSHIETGKELFENGGIEQFKQLEWNARSKMLIARLEDHYHILDCEVKGEALSVKNRKINSSYDMQNTLQYNFNKAEYVNFRINISELSHYIEDQRPKDKKVEIATLEAVKMNESYMMITENENGDKIEIFLNVYKRDKDFIEFSIPYEEERRKLQTGETLKPGRLIRVSDPSLLRRRNKLGEFINIMEGCIRRGIKPSTGHEVYDIALNVSQSNAQKKEERVVLFKDSKLIKDKSQKATVEDCVNPDLPFHLIQGPPGTGKTRVTVELIRQFYAQGKRVLVVSQSNAGIDNLGKKLLALEDNGADIKFARVGNEELVIDEALRDHWSNRREKLIEMYDNNSRRGCIVLGTTNGFSGVTASMTDKKIYEYYRKYDVVIVEEAGRATLAETIYPISWVEETGKVILVGDHKQLPAYGIDKRKQEEILRELIKAGYDENEIKQYLTPEKVTRYKTSLFQDLWFNNKYFKSGVNKHFLAINRRSHWAIVRLVSELFYNDKILPDPNRVDSVLEEDTLRVIDYDKRSGKKNNEKKEPGASVLNLKEAYIVMDEVDRFLAQEKGENPRYLTEDITIITPYDMQRREILKLLAIKSIINDLRSGEIFSYSENQKSERLEYLKSFLFESPLGYDQEVLKAIARMKQGKGEIRETDINKILESENFIMFRNKYGMRRFSYKDFRRLKVENVDSIQGSENKVVILSMVRSNEAGDIGFLGTKDGLQRLNVAYSRAQEKFTIVGDFANTLCRADPKKNGKWNTNIEKAREVFNKTIEIYEELYIKDNNGNKNMGGEDADNRKVIEPIIQNALKNSQVIKLTFNPRAKFYKPKFIKNYRRTQDDIEEISEAFLTEQELNRLEGYLKKAMITIRNKDELLSLKDIKIAIIKDRTYINPSSDNQFSIVHAGERTATIWFGELFLLELLKGKNDQDMQDLIEHELRHILDSFNAMEQHKEGLFEDLKDRLDIRGEKVRARQEARKMLDILSEKGEAIEKSKKLIIGLDLSWMPDAQSVKILLSQLQRLSGKDNIVLKIGEAKSLAAEINKEVEDKDFSNVIILGSTATVYNAAFDYMRNNLQSKRAFFAEIDPREIEKELAPGVYNYLRIIEMINISMALAFKDGRALGEIEQMYPGIMIQKTLSPNVFLFIPKAKPVELKELNELYKAQAKVIFSA